MKWARSTPAPPAAGRLGRGGEAGSPPVAGAAGPGVAVDWTGMPYRGPTAAELTISGRGIRLAAPTLGRTGMGMSDGDERLGGINEYWAGALGLCRSANFYIE